MDPPDPKERGAQLQNVSAIELRRLLDSYYQPAGLNPSESAPPPWGPVPRQPLHGNLTPPVDCLAPCVEGSNTRARQSEGALPDGRPPGPHAGQRAVGEGPGTHSPAAAARHGDLDPRCLKVSRMVVLDDVPREARQPSCSSEPKRRLGQDTEHGQWTTSAYPVVDSVRDGIIASLGAGTPTVDAFASAVNARFPRFWTRQDDAFSKDWGTEELLWINPPFEHFARVIRKIAVDSARAIVIAPHWTHLRWPKALQGITLSRVLIPKGKPSSRMTRGRSSARGNGEPTPTSSMGPSTWKTSKTTASHPFRRYRTTRSTVRIRADQEGSAATPRNIR